MATTTQHLGLIKPAGTDSVSIQVINTNYDKIDAGILGAMRGRAARSLLVNGDFREPVNQRGKWGSNLSTGYTMDRWYIWENGANITASQGKYVSVEGASISQYLPEPYDRGVVTLAVKVYGVTTPLICAYDTSKVGAARDGAAAIVRNASSLCVSLDAGQNYEWAALYEGEYTAGSLPEFVPNGYAAELMECRRYYCRITKLFGTSIGYVSREVIQLPVTMRVKPTVTTASIWTGAQGSGYTLNTVTQDTVDIQYTGWGNLVLDVSADS